MKEQDGKLNPLLRYLAGAFLIAPAMSITLIFIASLPFIQNDLWAGYFFALKWGWPIGLIHGLIMTCQLQHLRPLKVIVTLSGFYLFFSLIGFVFMGFGPFLGVLGYWIGYAVLLDGESSKSTEPAAGRQS